MKQRLDPFDLRGQAWPPVGWDHRPAPTKAQRHAATRRQREWRRRQQQGLVVLQVSVPEHAVAEALLAAGTLTAEQALDRHHVEHAISDMVIAWAHAWRGK